MKITMDLSTAQRIIDEAVAGRKRWGMMWVSEYSPDNLLDALICVSGALEESLGGVPREEHTLVTRQLTASKAREAKLKKKIEKLEDIIKINKLADD